MKDKIFIDTNILVYLYSKDEPAKKAISVDVLAKNNGIISTQVLQELSTTLNRKYKVEWKTVFVSLNEIAKAVEIYINKTSTINLSILINNHIIKNILYILELGINILSPN